MASKQLREFFASLASETALQQLVAQKAAEDLNLEFKTKRDATKPALDDSEVRTFSKALSGFANSEGGILVWGIQTDPQDRATALQPISQVDVFRVRLQKSVLNATHPPVDGVEFQVIPAAGSLAAGFLGCLVPSSDRVPHRAVLADREYYRRTADGFRRLEHYELEDMFGRRPRPALSLR